MRPQELRAAQQRAEQLESDLSTARARQQWTPEAAQFASLERRVDELVAEGAAREAKWRSVLEDSQHMYSAQAEMINTKW